MVLENENCRVKIEADETYTINSADNRRYDLVLNPGGYGRGDFSRTFSIEIDLFTREFSIALIGAPVGFDSDCAVLEENVLTVLQDDAVTQLNIFDGSVIRYKKLDCFGGCNFAIYKVSGGYIIYGELEITMLDLDLCVKWSFSGKDIFASVTGKTPFEMFEDYICLYDFEDNCYKIDYNGKLLEKN